MNERDFKMVGAQINSLIHL